MPLKWIPRSKSGASKSRPRWAAHTRIGNVWEYPPRKHLTIFKEQTVILFPEVTILYNKFVYFVTLYYNNFSPSSCVAFFIDLSSVSFPLFNFFLVLNYLMFSSARLDVLDKPSYFESFNLQFFKVTALCHLKFCYLLVQIIFEFRSNGKVYQSIMAAMICFTCCLAFCICSSYISMFCMMIALASFRGRTVVLFSTVTKACSYTAATNSATHQHPSLYWH